MEDGRGASAGAARLRPYFMLAFLVVAWGYLWVPGKVGVAHSNAFVWAGLRTFPAYVIVVVVLLVLRRPIRPKNLGFAGLIGVLQVGGFVGFTSAALVTAGAGHTGMLANTWQLWILVMAWLILGERLRGMEWLGVAIGVAGLVLIIEPWKIHGLVSSLLAIAGALCFGGGAVAMKVLRRRGAVDLPSLTAWQGLLGSLPLAVLAFIFPGNGIHWTVSFAASLAYGIVIGTALGALLWLYLLTILPAKIAGVGQLATPIIGVLASWLQLGEHLSAAEIFGMALVVLALSLLVIRGLRAAPRTDVVVQYQTTRSTR